MIKYPLVTNLITQKVALKNVCDQIADISQQLEKTNNTNNAVGIVSTVNLAKFTTEVTISR